MDRIASVEVTSEENGYPIESALLRAKSGVGAATPGTQFIRLIFDEPQKLKRIRLVFEDAESTRTQEFACDGLLILNVLFEKLYANNGISVSPTRYARQRTTRLKSPESKRLN